MIFFSRINEHLRTQEKLRVEDCKEGEELKKLAVQFQIEKERLESIRKDERKSLMKENMQQIHDVEKMKILQQRQDEVCLLSLGFSSLLDEPSHAVAFFIIFFYCTSLSFYRRKS